MLPSLSVFFCKTRGHLRKHCELFKDYLRANGKEVVNVCEESNLIEVPINSWWFDTGCTVHITNSLHGFEKQKDSSFNCCNVFVGEGTKVAVRVVRIVKLKLSSGFVLSLNDVLYVPKMRRNLISASKLVKSGFSFLGDDEYLRLFQKGCLDSIIGTASFVENLWQLGCSVVVNEHHALSTNTKRMLEEIRTHFKRENC